MQKHILIGCTTLYSVNLKSFICSFLQTLNYFQILHVQTIADLQPCGNQSKFPQITCWSPFSSLNDCRSMSKQNQETVLTQGKRIIVQLQSNIHDLIPKCSSLLLYKIVCSNLLTDDLPCTTLCSIMYFLFSLQTFKRPQKYIHLMLFLFF